MHHLLCHRASAPRVPILESWPDLSRMQKMKRPYRNTGTGCLERLCTLYPWKCSRPGWSKRKVFLLIAGWWNEMVLKGPSNLNHSMIL